MLSNQLTADGRPRYPIPLWLSCPLLVIKLPQNFPSAEFKELELPKNKIGDFLSSICRGLVDVQKQEKDALVPLSTTILVVFLFTYKWEVLYSILVKGEFDHIIASPSWVGVGTVRFGAVLSETTTETEFFCGAVRCGFEDKTEMKPNRLVRFGAVSNGFGLVFEKKCTF